MFTIGLQWGRKIGAYWALFLGIAIAFTPSHAWAEGDGQIQVAVLPLNLERGPELYRWMQSSIPLALGDKLGALPDWQMVDPLVSLAQIDNGALERGVDRPMAVAVGEDLQADLVLWGDVWKVGMEMGFTLYLTSIHAPELDLIRLQKKGEIDAVNALISEAALAVADGVGAPLDEALEAQLNQKAARDRYTLTLWGRGVNAYLGYYAPQDLELARKHLMKALRIDPQLATGWYSLGECHLSLQRLDHAHSAYYEALRRQSNHAHARLRLARMAVEAQSHNEAHEHLLVLRKVRPDDAWVRYHLARVLFHLGRHALALDEVQSALSCREISQDLRIQSLELAVELYGELGDRAGLELALTQLLTAKPGDDGPRIRLMGLAYFAGDWETATAHLAALSDSLSPQLSAQLRGELALAQGQNAEAVEAFASGLSLAKKDGPALAYLARAYQAEGKDFAALNLLSRAEATAEGPRYRLERARLLLEMDRVDEALALLTGLGQAKKIPPALLGAHAQLLAEAHLKRGDCPGAIAALKAHLADDNLSGRAHFIGGLCHLEAGAHEKALAAFDRAIEAEGSFPEAEYNRIVALNLAGRLAEADAAHGAYLQAYPGLATGVF